MTRPQINQRETPILTILALSFLCVIALGKISVAFGQQSTDSPFANLDDQIKSQGGWGLENQRLSNLFNLARKQLGNRFEPALMEYLGKDVDKHYWISAFLEAPTYLQGATPLPQLSLLIKQQALALLGEQTDQQSLSDRVRFGVTAAVLSKQLGLHELAVTHKTTVERLIQHSPALSASVPGMVDEKRKLYESLPPHKPISTGKKDLLTWKAEAVETMPNGNQPGNSIPKRINVSGGVLQQQAIKKVQPPYPVEARVALVEGPVKVQILISEEGQVIEATVLEGAEQLAPAAMAAARQWTFKPVTLSGQAVRMSGILTFNFTLK